MTFKYFSEIVVLRISVSLSYTSSWKIYITLFLIIVLLFICAYNTWVISPACPHPLPYHPLHPLPLPPTPSIPNRNYFAFISNFVEERV
jgi:hypothetical protein